MKSEWVFELKGKPVPLARARVNTKDGRFYTPKRSVNYEKAIHWAAKAAKVRKIGKGEYVKAEMLFVRKDAGRCDLDNLVKAVFDGLRYYFNDNKVYDLWARKEKGKNEKTVIIIRYDKR